MAETLDETAQRIAERGREALLVRLRPAFEEAAAAHADVLELDADELEQMVQRAVDRADGLQWRRALAAVATEELGIGLGEALGHPAVERAQSIVGAPSYEESLAAIIEGSLKRPTDDAEGSDAEPADTAEPDGAEPDGAELLAADEVAGPDPGHAEAPEDETGDAPGEDAPRAYAASLRILIGVVHVDGLPKLDGERGLELRFSERGLDVVRQGGGATLITFFWREIQGIDVRPGRGRMLRRSSGSRLILITTGRLARFDVRDEDHRELRERLEPALARIRARD